MLRIRIATEADSETIRSVYRAAQEFMIRTGNPNQWGRSYPDEERIRADIRQNACRVLCDETGIHGVFALFRGAEPTYARIEGGEWLNSAPYVTIHRMAGDGTVHGLFRCAVQYCKGLSDNIRIDTHADNRIMQTLIEKNGFVKCGIIHVSDGTPRIAYHWTER